jgi:hypothetical protein
MPGMSLQDVMNCRIHFSSHHCKATTPAPLVYCCLQVKAPDMPGMSLRGVVKCLMSQCQSMGVRVVERPEDA